MELIEYLAQPNIKGKAFADQLRIPQPLLSQWSNKDRPVPDGRCPAIEFESHGQVTCEELRSDITWVRIPDKTWPHPKGRPLVDHSVKAAA